MNKQPPNYTVEFLYREYNQLLQGYITGRFRDLAHEAEDVVQELFVELQKRGTKILGDCSIESLKKHARRQALNTIRNKNTLKRGGGNLVSLEAMHEEGFETENALLGLESVSSFVPQQFMLLQYLEKLEEVEKVIEAAKPELSEREAILLGHIQNWAPIELNNVELRQELTPMQRQRFLPVGRDVSLEKAEVFIYFQITRSKASLQRKLREKRDSMGN